MKLHAQPTIILLSTRVDESIDAYLDPGRGSRDSASGDRARLPPCPILYRLPKFMLADIFALPYIVEVRPMAEFGYEAGKTKLASIRLGRDVAPRFAFITPGDSESYLEYAESNEPGYTGRQGKLLHLSSLIHLESRLTVGCAGAVLTYLQRKRAVMYLPGDTEGTLALQVSFIETFSLSGNM